MPPECTDCSKTLLGISKLSKKLSQATTDLSALLLKTEPMYPIKSSKQMQNFCPHPELLKLSPLTKDSGSGMGETIQLIWFLPCMQLANLGTILSTTYGPPKYCQD